MHRRHQVRLSSLGQTTSRLWFYCVATVLFLATQPAWAVDCDISRNLNRIHSLTDHIGDLTRRTLQDPATPSAGRACRLPESDTISEFKSAATAVVDCAVDRGQLDQGRFAVAGFLAVQAGNDSACLLAQEFTLDLYSDSQLSQRLMSRDS